MTATTVLDGELTIRQAQALHRQLLAAAGEGARALDLAGVSELDSAGVQLLLAACRAEPPMTIAAASPVVRDVFRCYGLDAWLPAA